MLRMDAALKSHLLQPYAELVIEHILLARRRSWDFRQVTSRYPSSFNPSARAVVGRKFSQCLRELIQVALRSTSAGSADWVLGVDEPVEFSEDFFEQATSGHEY